MIPRVSVAVNLACFALLVWLYGGDLYDVTRAASAEVTALTSLPSVPFASGVVALAFAGGALTLLGVTKKRDGNWRGYRLMPIVTVVSLFVDLFVVSADRSPISSTQRTTMALEQFQQGAMERSSQVAVLSDPLALQAIADALGAPPWLQRAQPVTKWVVAVEHGCVGPRVDSRGALVGTLFYCVAPDRTRAYVTAVGLPREERFGAARVMTVSGQPVVAQVLVKQPESPPEPAGEDAPTDVGGSMYFEGDAGNLSGP